MAEKTPSKSKLVRIEAEKQANPDKPEFVREFEFQYYGETYTVRNDAFEDVELLEALEDEKFITALRLIIGVESWGRFKESVRDSSGRVSTAMLEEFITLVMEQVNPSATS